MLEDKLRALLPLATDEREVIVLWEQLEVAGILLAAKLTSLAADTCPTVTTGVTVDGPVNGLCTDDTDDGAEELSGGAPTR